MHMSYIFAGITLIAVCLTTVLRQMKQVVLSLWVAGLGVGAIYLTLGAEFLAIIQWIISTLVALSFIFFSVMFGEYESSQGAQEKVSPLMMVLAFLTGTGFVGVITLGLVHLDHSKINIETPPSGDLISLGRVLTQEHLLSLELLGLILFIVLIGGGVITRFEGDDQS